MITIFYSVTRRPRHLKQETNLDRKSARMDMGYVLTKPNCIFQLLVLCSGIGGKFGFNKKYRKRPDYEF